MPGYDKSRNVGMSAEELDEYTCGICQDMIKNPLFTKCCQQTYYKECIKVWQTSNNTCPNERKELRSTELLPPPRLVINVVNNIKIKCEYQENGFSSDLKICESPRHLVECENRIVM